MNDPFSSHTLVEKLSKLNNSQQSIETLSHWCVFHRKKAKQIVETWEKLFNGSSIEQRVPFLYLANDILQNSRRAGSEFMNEFWKVLPGALRSVCENGDGRGKDVVTRLVAIWDERKVFGSRGRGLKDTILGQKPPLPPTLPDNNGSSSNPIIVVRKDAHSMRIKLPVGGTLEKIITSYHSVLDEHLNEDTALNKCKDAVRYVGRMEKDVDDACTKGIQQGSLMNEVQEQETILRQCTEQLASVEATRAALIAHLKEALQEQETKMELIQTQLQVAQAETERALNMKQRLVSAAMMVPVPNTAMVSLPVETSTPPSQPLQQPLYTFTNSLAPPLPQLPHPPSRFPISLTSPPRPQPSLPVPSSLNTSPPPPPQPSQPVTSLTISTTTEEQNKKAAADVVAKLTASTSSAQMLTSVLTSLLSEEAVSGAPGLGAFVSSSPPIFPEAKRPKLEKPMTASERSNAFFGHMHLPSQTNQPPPPPPPLPPLPPPPAQQYVQTSGGMVGMAPFSFGGSGLPPLPMARPGGPQPPLPPLPPVPPPQQQQFSTMMGFFQPPGIGFYGQMMGPPVPGLGESTAGKGSSM